VPGLTIQHFLGRAAGSLAGEEPVPLAQAPAEPARQRGSSPSAQMSNDCGAPIQAPRF